MPPKENEQNEQNESAKVVEHTKLDGIDMTKFDNLSSEEIKFAYYTFLDIGEHKKAEYFKDLYIKMKIPAIEIPSIGYRIWSYFYEKNFLRLGLIAWALTLNGLQILFTYAIPLPGTLKYMLWPDLIKNNLLVMNGMAVPLGSLIYILGFFVIIILWHAYIAYHESMLNIKHPGMSPLRKKLGIMVVDKNGRPLDFAHAFFRGFFRFYPLALIQVVIFEIAQKPCLLHDILFSTYVIKINQEVTPDEIRAFLHTLR